jgi:hypothetical protein
MRRSNSVSRPSRLVAMFSPMGAWLVQETIKEIRIFMANRKS